MIALLAVFAVIAILVMIVPAIATTVARNVISSFDRSPSSGSIDQSLVEARLGRIEEAIDAMKHLKTRAVLIIIGIGDIFSNLDSYVKKEGLNDRVLLIGQVPLEHLSSYTRMADIGISIEKDVSLNYHYCLPNKFLDYIQCNIPVLISPLVEMKAIVEKYLIGEMIENHDPETLAGKLDNMLSDTARLAFYRENLVKAASELCWENEEKELISIFKEYA